MIEAGSTFLSNNYGEVEVLEYVSTHEVHIKFYSGEVKVVSVNNLIKGEVSPKKSEYKGLPLKELLKRNKAYKNYTIIEDHTYCISFTCSLCNCTYGLSDYLFKCSRASLKEGRVPCLCSKKKNLSDEYLRRSYYNTILKGKGEYSTTFSVRGKKKVEWYCNRGHKALSNSSDLISKNTNCAICKSTNYFNILYVVILSDGNRELSKIGVTNNLKSRISAYEKEGLTVLNVKYITTYSLEESNALHLEQEILFYARLYGLDDKCTFKNYTGYTEMLDSYYYTSLVYVLDSIQAEGELSEYSLRFLLDI